jgi:inosose dehydratase
MGIRGIASAPVSFGVYGAGDQLCVSPLALLDGVGAAGYRGMELGPPGFFGTPGQTGDAFALRELIAVGAYVPIHFSADDATVAHDLAGMERTLAELACASTPAGIAILADEGSPELLLHPARNWHDRGLALDESGWQRLADGMARALELAEHAGVPTSFHPHISTYVESPWEIDRLLESTAVQLTLDTGHFWLAGADPAEQIVRYGERVNHVHLKDVRRAVLEQAKAAGRTDVDTWWGEVATPLGAGDVDLERFLASLLRTEYDGWLVIEQDRLPLGTDAIEPVIAEQAGNRRWVEEALARLGHKIGVDASTGGGRSA